MLTAAEKNCISEIVELISFNDLISLGSTATDNCLEIKSKEDALKSLFLHETSFRSFLSRRKITRGVLFKYLHSKEINFRSSIDKHELINLTVYYVEQKESHAQVSQEIVRLGPDEARVLGYQFVEWFYTRLNVSINQSEGPQLTEDDFWDDCQLSIFVRASPNDSHTLQANSAQETLMLFKTVESQYALLFSPNLSPEGVKTIVEPHGLVLVMVCGTLHSTMGNCVGVFEQKFGLIKNPLFANNYKIKKSKLVLRNNDSSDMKMIEN